MPLGVTGAKLAQIGLQRFGLGPKPHGAMRIGESPMGAILEEIDRPNRVLINSSGLPGYVEACVIGQSDFETAHNLLKIELRARYNKALHPEVGFVERLVRFWSNHFSMSVEKSSTVRGTIGHLERSVIRPNVLGNFRDMLHGVMKHPSMINFLDNQDSIGPRTRIARRHNRGMNDNLGRELLELHTVGVDAGYTEEDVSAAAKIITGWSYVRGWESDGGWNGGTQQNRGQFVYRPDWHEPGSAYVMGVGYPPVGQQQGEMLLDDLAVHPKTAEHIAFKLVQHFITDMPRPHMVEPIAAAFSSSGGDLKEVALALVNLPAAWNAPLKKIRLPDEITIAQLRAFNLPLPPPNDRWKWHSPLYALNHLPWECSSPAGYPEETAAWLSPDGMRVRSDTAQLFVNVQSEPMTKTAETLAYELFDDALSSTSMASIRAGTSRRQQMTALLMTPEFQRR